MVDRRQAILEAARRVFSRHGFHKASIKQIAREADIKSAGLIYHYFDDKAALLSAVIEELSLLSKVPVFDPAGADHLMDVPPDVLLPQMARAMLNLQDDSSTVSMIRLYVSEAVRNPVVADAVVHLQRRGVGFLTAYLQHQIELGRLRVHDVDASARMLIGSMLLHILGHQVFTLMADGFPSREDYIEEVVAIFLDGVRIAPEKSET